MVLDLKMLGASGPVVELAIQLVAWTPLRQLAAYLLRYYRQHTVSSLIILVDC